MHSHSDGSKACQASQETYNSGADVSDRQAWMAVLAWAPRALFDQYWDAARISTSYETLRPAESGMILTRGRVGGDGQPFNLGEMTVTRCTIRLPDGTLGHAYQAGRDRIKAERSAVLDALLQTAEHGRALDASIIEPLKSARKTSDAARAAKVAATRVDFFTMVRGD